jgi:hypothetical protein
MITSTYFFNIRTGELIKTIRGAVENLAEGQTISLISSKVKDSKQIRYRIAGIFTTIDKDTDAVNQYIRLERMGFSD